ncbi:MAG: hypothetical protein M1833_002960 [Piccolia ochrophora]|nr:MAG: hypothetical protein M1833_002960 [Piccolia ochrophora]
MMPSSTSTHTFLTYDHSPSSSQLLSSSTSTKEATAHLQRTYRHASNLFLTKRLPEALSALSPVISSPGSDDPPEDEEQPQAPPIATASKSLRIKTWSLYLTLLDSILKLSPSEGKDAFGRTRWRETLSKVRDGVIWEDVVRDGYAGVEGALDADVVINLATLLLAHSPSQALTQQRLESYLSASPGPTVEAFPDTDPSLPGNEDDAENRRLDSTQNGAITPRELNSRIKIIELFTLHVLPQNEEWEYAKEFINMSEVLDDERREIFNQALRSVQEEDGQNKQTREDEGRQDEALTELEPRVSDVHEDPQSEPARETSRQEPSQAHLDHKRQGSETDYGIEGHPNRPKQDKASQGPRKRKDSIPNTTRPSPLSQSSRPAKKVPKSQGFVRRATNVMVNLQDVIKNMALSMNTNPMLLLRTLLFLVGLLLALSRKDIRDRVGRLTGAGWNKLKATVGMGVKVSYM